MKTKYEDVFELIFSASGLKICFSDESHLLNKWMEVFNNDTFKRELGKFLMMQHMKPRHQRSLKKLDYDYYWLYKTYKCKGKPLFATPEKLGKAR